MLCECNMSEKNWKRDGFVSIYDDRTNSLLGVKRLHKQQEYRYRIGKTGKVHTFESWPKGTRRSIGPSLSALRINTRERYSSKVLLLSADF